MRGCSFNHPTGASCKIKIKEAGASRLLFYPGIILLIVSLVLAGQPVAGAGSGNPEPRTPTRKPGTRPRPVPLVFYLLFSYNSEVGRSDDRRPVMRTARPTFY